MKLSDVPEMSPCVKERCLKYPVCRLKQIITCTSFDTYFTYIHTCFNSVEDCWEYINKFLPNAVVIECEFKDIDKDGFPSLPWQKNLDTKNLESFNDSKRTTV